MTQLTAYISHNNTFPNSGYDWIEDYFILIKYPPRQNNAWWLWNIAWQLFYIQKFSDKTWQKLVKCDMKK